MILGFSIAAPVGPIGLLCIRKTLKNGRLAGFVSGLGAATADCFYGYIAAFGLVTVSSFLIKYELLIKIVGAFFLFYLAIKIFTAKQGRISQETTSSTGLTAAFFSTFFLTITNPATIISFIAAFAVFGIGTTGDLTAARLIVVGVFLGSVIWWLILSLFVGIFRNYISHKGMFWINRLSGITMIFLGLLGFLPNNRL